MREEAKLEQTDSGATVAGPGWFIANLRDLRWQAMRPHGAWCAIQHDDTPQQIGVGPHMLWAGDMMGRHHWESDQEGFLVLEGECLAVVEGQERRLRRWDYFHCPPGTAHIIVGAGDGPCVVFCLGARTPGGVTRYEPDEVAARHRASVRAPTTSSKAAYADLGERTPAPVRAPWPAEA